MVMLRRGRHALVRLIGAVLLSGLWRRRAAVIGVTLAGVLAVLLPLAPAAASGAIWLATERAIQSAMDKSQPSLATSQGHAYLLWLGGNYLANHGAYQVYYTTNASGAWQTRVLTADGPSAGGALDGPRALIAVDPTLKRLYAVWPTAKVGLVLYTSDNEGATWQGPTTLVKNDVFGAIFPDIALAAGGGKVAVAFKGGPPDFGKGACTDAGGDIYVVTYNGTTWSTQHNLTSCVSGQAGGFRTSRLAYDAMTGRFALVAEDDSGTFRLWYAEGSGTTWSTPALTPMTHLVTGLGNFYNGDYRVAAAGGRAYVAYPLSMKSVPHLALVDIYLATHTSGLGWTVQRVTQDPLDCQKFDVALAALPHRIALAYIWSGWCAKTGGSTHGYIHVLTGLPGHFQETVPLRPPVPADCVRPLLSTDGPIFRVVQLCSNVGTKGNDFSYTPEFWDVTGPIVTALVVPGTATAPTVTLHWMAQDPAPGAGVADYEVQVREDTGPWQWAVPGGVTPATTLSYHPVSAGHHYTFQVRARDKVDNWGAWVSSTTLVQ